MSSCDYNYYLSYILSSFNVPISLLITPAKESGIPIKTIRYYEEMGLITSSSRTEGKYRLFKTEAIARLAFIKTLQRLGLSLQEILEVLTVYDGGQLPCDDIKQKLEAQLVEIDLHLIEIMALRQKVSGLLASWQIDADALKSNGNLTRSAEISHFTSKFIPLKIYK